LSGLVTRRVDVSGKAGYANGASALNQRNTIQAYTGDVTVRFGLTRSVAILSEYIYFYYNVHGRGLVIASAPETFQQHGVRIGLTLWTSAF
jgi:hypothetical protein